jgi:hypothetical protein
MFDAQIAATLLNRWDDKGACPGGQLPLQLLREGNLHFKHEGGDVHANDTPADQHLRVECLTFADGSRALRVAEGDGQSGWTRWTAAEPIRKLKTSPRIDGEILSPNSKLAFRGGRRPDGDMALQDLLVACSVTVDT